MSKHTPGPWEVEENTLTAEEGKASLLGERHILKTEVGPYRIEGRYVTVTGDVSGVGSEAEGNARLIAAAPDLLAELQEVAAMFSRVEAVRELKGYERKRAESVRAAIAKATGEEK